MAQVKVERAERRRAPQEGKQGHCQGTARASCSWGIGSQGDPRVSTAGLFWAGANTQYLSKATQGRVPAPAEAQITVRLAVKRQG